LHKGDPSVYEEKDTLTPGIGSLRKEEEGKRCYPLAVIHIFFPAQLLINRLLPWEESTFFHEGAMGGRTGGDFGGGDGLNHLFVSGPSMSETSYRFGSREEGDSGVQRKGESHREGKSSESSRKNFTSAKGHISLKTGPFTSPGEGEVEVEERFFNP